MFNERGPTLEVALGDVAQERGELIYHTFCLVFHICLFVSVWLQNLVKIYLFMCLVNWSSTQTHINLTCKLLKILKFTHRSLISQSSMGIQLKTC